MSCLSVNSGVTKKFQRPMTKRRSYDKRAEEALIRSSLGQKRRFDGMAKLMARAGKGLAFKSTNIKVDRGSDESGSESEDEKEEERPFEPLLVWKSPADGGDAKGLPPKL